MGFWARTRHQELGAGTASPQLSGLGSSGGQGRCDLGGTVSLLGFKIEVGRCWKCSFYFPIQIKSVQQESLYLAIA